MLCLTKYLRFNAVDLYWGMFTSAAPLTVTARQKRELETLIHSGNTPQRGSLRARLMLLAQNDAGNHAIAQELNVSRPTRTIVNRVAIGMCQDRHPWRQVHLIMDNYCTLIWDRRLAINAEE